jgi:hypothetical protein
MTMITDRHKMANTIDIERQMIALRSRTSRANADMRCTSDFCNSNEFFYFHRSSLLSLAFVGCVTKEMNKRTNRFDELSCDNDGNVDVDACSVAE